MIGATRAAKMALPMNPTETERVRVRALEMLAQGRSLCEVLTYLVLEAETVSHGGSVCSVLLLDEEGLLRNGASPGLPADYLAAIDRLKPDPAIGTYFREPRKPRPEERSFVEALAQIACEVTERSRESAGTRNLAPAPA